MDFKQYYDLSFKCGKCGSVIDHNYTEVDIFDNDYLELVCQNCASREKVKTEKIKEEAIEKFQKDIQKMFQ